MSSRSLSVLARRVALIVVAALLVAVPVSAQAAGSVRATPDGPCTTPDGVTVVVDFTDVGGKVEMGCATAPASGTAALEAAGFADTRDASQLICAIDDAPKPCPATFTGSYWSYWHASPGGTWTSYQVGSDTAVPAAGQVEGWRYNDGSAGPTVEPPVAVATDTAAPAAGASPTAATTAPASSNPSGASLAGFGLLALLAVLALLVARRRSRGSSHGPAGQD